MQCLGIEPMQVGAEYLNERLIRRPEGALLVAVADKWQSAEAETNLHRRPAAVTVAARRQLVARRGLSMATATPAKLAANRS